MVIMIGHVGYWPYANGQDRTKPCLAVDFDDCMVEWASTLPGSDRRVCFEVTHNRKLIIKPCADGVAVSFGSRGQRKACTSETNNIRVLQLAIPLPLFQQHAIEFKEDGQNLVGELAADHELPWPSGKTVKACSDPEVLCKEALEARVFSMVASGLSALGNNSIPNHIRTHLPMGAYMEAVRTAKALSGV